VYKNEVSSAACAAIGLPASAAVSANTRFQAAVDKTDRRDVGDDGSMFGRSEDSVVSEHDVDDDKNDDVVVFGCDDQDETSQIMLSNTINAKNFRAADDCNLSQTFTVVFPMFLAV